MIALLMCAGDNESKPSANKTTAAAAVDSQIHQ